MLFKNEHAATEHQLQSLKKTILKKTYLALFFLIFKLNINQKTFS